jgi:hypothetical protein
VFSTVISQFPTIQIRPVIAFIHVVPVQSAGLMLPIEVHAVPTAISRLFMLFRFSMLIVHTGFMLR